MLCSQAEICGMTKKPHEKRAADDRRDEAAQSRTAPG
jgi:hypothetical protein